MQGDLAEPSPASPAERPNYRADVDGLRAVAVLSVLFFHAGWSGFAGGFTGVDVFFVISGFVIALSLFREIDAGTFSLSAFYARRIRRILPALTAVLLGTLAVSLLVVPPVYFKPFVDSLVAAALFISNIHFWQDSSYFNSDSPFRPLLHTWSLGVEEQYYLVVPVFLLVIQRWLGGRWRLVSSLCLAGSLLLCVAAVETGHVDAAFYLAPTRAWEFLLGVLVALLPPLVMPRLIQEAGAAFGLVLVLGAVFFFGPATQFPGGMAIVPCAGAAMMIYFGRSERSPGGETSSMVSRLLTMGPFVWTGRISYSLYLIHWPVLVLAPFILMRRLTYPETLAALVLSFALAALLHGFVETPARRARAKTGTVLIAGLICVLGTVAVGKVGEKINEAYFKGRIGSEHVPDLVGAEQSWGVLTCLLVVGQPASEWTPDACRIGRGPDEDVLLFGDSFAAHYVPGLKANADHLRAGILEYAMEGCPPTLARSSPGDEACRVFRKNVVNIVKRHAIRRVIVAGSWLEYGVDAAVDVESTLAELRALGVDVTLIGQSPNFYLPPYLVDATKKAGRALDVTLPLSAEVREMNALLATIAARTGARFIDPTDTLCPNGVCVVRSAGTELFLDYGHLSPEGAAVAVRAYFPYVDR